MNWKILPVLVSVASLIALAFGAYLFIEITYAKAENVQKIEQRLDYKIKNDQRETIQKRVWLLEDRYVETPMPESVKEEYRGLKEDKKTVEDEIKELRKK